MRKNGISKKICSVLLVLVLLLPMITNAKDISDGTGAGNRGGGKVVYYVWWEAVSENHLYMHLLSSTGKTEGFGPTCSSKGKLLADNAVYSETFAEKHHTEGNDYGTLDELLNRVNCDPESKTYSLTFPAKGHPGNGCYAEWNVPTDSGAQKGQVATTVDLRDLPGKKKGYFIMYDLNLDEDDNPDTDQANVIKMPNFLNPNGIQRYGEYRVLTLFELMYWKARINDGLTGDKTQMANTEYNRMVTKKGCLPVDEDNHKDLGNCTWYITSAGNNKTNGFLTKTGKGYISQQETDEITKGPWICFTLKWNHGKGFNAVYDLNIDGDNNPETDKAHVLTCPTTEETDVNKVKDKKYIYGDYTARTYDDVLSALGTNEEDLKKILSKGDDKAKAELTKTWTITSSDADSFLNGETYNGGETKKVTKGTKIVFTAGGKAKPGATPSNPTPACRIDYYGDGATEANGSPDGTVDPTMPPAYNTPVELKQDTGRGSLFDRILKSDEYANVSGTDDSYDEQEAVFAGWNWEGTDLVGKTMADFTSVKSIQVSEVWPHPTNKVPYTVTYTGQYSMGNPNATVPGPHTGTLHTLVSITASYTDAYNYNLPTQRTTNTYAPGTAGWVRWTFYDEGQISRDYEQISAYLRQIQSLKNTYQSAYSQMHLDVSGCYERYSHDTGKTWVSTPTKDDPSAGHYEYYDYCHCYQVHNHHGEDPGGWMGGHAAWQQQINNLEDKVDGLYEAIDWLMKTPYSDHTQSQTFKGGITASLAAASPINMRSRWKEYDKVGQNPATTEFAQTQIAKEQRIDNHDSYVMTANALDKNGETSDYHEMGWYDTDSDGSRITGNKVSFQLGAGNSYGMDEHGSNTDSPFEDKEKIDEDTRLQEATEAGKAAKVKGNADDHYEWWTHWYSVITYDTYSGLDTLYTGNKDLTSQLFYPADQTRSEDAGQIEKTWVDTTPSDDVGVGITVDLVNDSSTVEDGGNYIGDEERNQMDIVYKDDENTHLGSINDHPAKDGNPIDITRTVHVKYQGQLVDSSIVFVGWNTKADGTGEWMGTDVGGETHSSATPTRATGEFTYEGPDITLYAQYRLYYDLAYNGNRQTAGEDKGYVEYSGDRTGTGLSFGTMYNGDTHTTDICVADPWTDETFSFRTNPATDYTNFERVEKSEIFYGGTGNTRKNNPAGMGEENTEAAQSYQSTIDSKVQGYLWKRDEMTDKNSVQSGMSGRVNERTNNKYYHAWDTATYPQEDDEIPEFIQEEWNDDTEKWIPIRHPYTWQGWSFNIGPVNDDGTLNTNWDDDAYFMDTKAVHGVNVYHCTNPLRPAGDQAEVSTKDFLVEALTFNNSGHGSGNVNIDPSISASISSDMADAASGYIGLTIYAVWDKAPDITSYYSISVGGDEVDAAIKDASKQDTLIKKLKQEILAQASVNDREDSDFINTLNATDENMIGSYTPTDIRDYSGNRQASDIKMWVKDLSFDELARFSGKATGAISVKIVAKDSAGNDAERMIKVWVNRDKEGDPRDRDHAGYDYYVSYRRDRVRQIDKEAFSTYTKNDFINELNSMYGNGNDLVGSPIRVNADDFFLSHMDDVDDSSINDSVKKILDENGDESSELRLGGLSSTSIWRLNPEYKAELIKALNNNGPEDGTGYYEDVYTLTGEQRKNIRDYIWKRKDDDNTTDAVEGTDAESNEGYGNSQKHKGTSLPEGTDETLDMMNDTSGKYFTKN